MEGRGHNIGVADQGTSGDSDSAPPTQQDRQQSALKVAEAAPTVRPLCNGSGRAVA
ncbi:hypothetical protein Nm8I071_24370 [Nonomuraea sp. TT08I-71]|nr:hypothetical protein Nm8I071_24370 [Nonomuraea sp. TT08I-71]